MIREIPRAFVCIRDSCKTEHRQENAGGHYTDSRPPHWIRLKIARSAHDYQGYACADASVERLLCDTCADRILGIINKETHE
jgi:hypothetical protein